MFHIRVYTRDITPDQWVSYVKMHQEMLGTILVFVGSRANGSVSKIADTVIQHHVT